MICPECGNKLHAIGRGRGEWYCDNPECSSNEDHWKSSHTKNIIKDYRGCTVNVWGEFYGFTQEKINRSATNANQKKMTLKKS